ncbi:class I SAM-dependent methyltransferase [Streptomyces sp. NPDC057539]|uniref:class I SAM-dependent methyltransferase n=1 Tax=Streptomyces sp. NPDC057539 TaxID=3346159 RepID=UPI00369CA46D
MDVSRRYRESWEGFWAATSDTPGEAIWDSDPSFTSVPDSELLLPYADATLPVVDLGCGNGTQTRYLATRFARAIGVDLSHAAIEHARHADTAGTAEFEQLDLVDLDAVRALRERTGDTNVYMRAVIHQSEPQDRRAVAAAVAELLGERGRAFVVELTSASKAVLQRAAAEPGGPPPKLRRVFDHGLKPAGAGDEEVPELLRAAGLRILADGDTALVQTEQMRDGTRIELPSRWYVLARE